MSRVGEKLAWMLNQLFPPLEMHKELNNAKKDISENQRWAYKEAQRVCAAFQPFWNLEGIHVLDIGCGLGGKLPLYINEGKADTLTAIDIDLMSTQNAKLHLASLGMFKSGNGIVNLASADAAALPFGDNCFDAIVSINVFEHIEHIESALLECFRVLKPDGLAFFHLPPYHSPWGPHLESWIHFPWPHLLFSEKTLMRVAALEDSKRNLNSEFLAAARIDWSAKEDMIPNLNRVTLRCFQRLYLKAGFSMMQTRLLPIGYEYFRNGTLFKQLLYRLLQKATMIPLLQEVIVTKAVYVLQKPAG
jgi:ubiquinone/menaquinone biosynthesis C-methylase UbiE